MSDVAAAASGPAPTPGTAVQMAAPAEAAPLRLIVRSIGTAPFSVVGALRKVMPVSEQQIAERLFRAPAELFADLPAAGAEQVVRILSDAGLDVEVLPKDATFTAGEADRDVALVVTDLSKMAAVVREVMGFLGVDAGTARRILCASPSMLVGGVSEATVQALRARLQPLGVEIAVSRPAEAVFDLVVGECPPGVRARLVDVLRHTRAAVIAGGDHGPFVATGLDRASAQRIWDEIGRRNPALRMLDRAFERFDIRLDACPRTPEAIAGLAAISGMPVDVAPRVLERLPVVVRQNLTYDEARATLAALADLGGQAVDELVTLQTFALQIEKVGTRAAALAVLRALSDVPEDTAGAALSAASGKLHGPFTQLHARWLKDELKAAGTICRLVRR